MMQAGISAVSGLMEFLCRPPTDDDREAALHAAASACLSVPAARRAWAQLQSHSVEAAADPAVPRFPYGVEIPIDLAGKVCGTVGMETEIPVDGAAHAHAAGIADFLATWEARRRLGDVALQQTIVGCSRGIRLVELLARRYAALDEPVLIQGETGVGKELIAQTLHCLSVRGDEPLCTINCAAVPDELIASELFGHRRGAFTGAVRDQRGRFEVADGATLFLDEIGEMGPSLQASLLRVLEHGELQQLGDEGRMRRINVRVIAASNRDLAAEVEAGRFRRDLYYRLTALTIDVPPLRSRPEDIPVLARYFISVLEDRWGQPLDVVSRALDTLLDYPFPGNVRELRNLVLRAAATSCGGRIDSIAVPDVAEPFRGRAVRGGLSHGHARAAGADSGRRMGRSSDAVAWVPNDVVFAAANRSLPRPRHGAGHHDALSLDSATEAHLRKVLSIAKGNVSKAARMLDIPRTTLQSKLRRYGVH